MFIRRVRGRSMSPFLEPGDIVIARNRPSFTQDIVIASLAGRQVIKRLVRIDHRGYYLVGDNRLGSTDSREFGSVKKSAILGVVIMRIRRVRAAAPPVVSSKRLLVFPYAAALLLTALVVCQLVTFDKLVGVFNGYNAVWGKLLLAGIVISEVFALPYLLRMRMSYAARVCSLLLGYLAIFLWLVPLNLNTSQTCYGLPLLGTLVMVNIFYTFLILFVLLGLLLLTHVIFGDMGTRSKLAVKIKLKK